jgi:hypothetical protein
MYVGMYVCVWWYRYEFPDTHNTHPHARNTTSAAGRLLAAALSPLCSCHFTRNFVSMIIRLRCMDDKISWLGGWAGQWRPPHMYVCMYVRTHVCMYVCTYVCMYVCVYIYIYT